MVIDASAPNLRSSKHLPVLIDSHTHVLPTTKFSAATMQCQRRKFLASTSAIIGGTITGITSPLHAGSVSSDIKVLDVISKYGTLLSTSRSGRAKIEHTVKIRSIESFISVFDPHKRLPFENIRVGTQNTLSFDLQGTQFTLRNVA